MYKIIFASCLLIFTGAMLFSVMKDKKETPSSTDRKTEEPAPFSHWQEFIPTSGKFKVSLPSKPRYVKDLVEIPDSDKKRLYEIYVSEEINGTTFMISVITYPQEFLNKTTSGKDILKGMIDELLVGRPDNRLGELEESTHQSNHAYNFDIDNDHLKIRGKTFLSGKRVYILSYVTRPEDADPKEYSRFVDSFLLISSEQDRETGNRGVEKNK